MGVDSLPLGEQKRVRWVLDWIGRMATKYGGIVYEKDGGWWDWGQSLCRECYGKDWSKIVPETPTWNDIGTANMWEQGKIPNWVDQERMKKHNTSQPTMKKEEV